MKRGIWKWALAIAVGLSLAVGSFVWSAHRRATAVFERHDALVKEAFAAIRARPTHRPRLDEPAVPGNGWSGFVKALSGFGTIPAADADELPSLNGALDFKPDPAKLDEIFERYTPLVEELRESLRHRDFNPAYRYEDGWLMDLPDGMSAIHCAKFLSDRASYFHQKEQGAAALESLLLGIAVGHETTRSGPLANCLNRSVCEGVAEDALREILAKHALKAGDLESFTSKLDRLRSARPELVDALVIDDALSRRSLVDVGLLGAQSPVTVYFGGLSFEGRSWRYLFSRRLACAGALDELKKLFEQSNGVMMLPPHLRAGAAGKVDRQSDSSKNPVSRSVFPGLGQRYRHDSSTLTNWTLMRVATALAWFEAEQGKLPETLSDLVPKFLPELPSCAITGKPLQYREGRVWSVGRNGVDDGGTPGSHNDASDEDGDVVWTVKRK